MAGFRTIVINKLAKLETKLGYLVIRTDKEERVHLSEIETLIIESTAVALTAMLISELSKNGVAIIFCDEKHLPESQVLPLNANFNSSGNVFWQILWKNEAREKCWTEIVKNKISMQSNVLKKQECAEYKMLDKYLGEVANGDTTNREGHAAKVYFNALFGKSFARKAENDINSALNYGYSIIMSAFAREVVAAGYLTQVGIWHRGEQNPYNFPCDLMEPFRPIVDFLVVNIFKDDSTDTKFKKKLQDLYLTKVKINNQIQQIYPAMRIFFRRIVQFLSGEATTIYFVEDFICGGEDEL